MLASAYDMLDVIRRHAGDWYGQQATWLQQGYKQHVLQEFFRLSLGRRTMQAILLPRERGNSLKTRLGINNQALFYLTQDSRCDIYENIAPDAVTCDLLLCELIVQLNTCLSSSGSAACMVPPNAMSPASQFSNKIRRRAEVLLFYGHKYYNQTYMPPRRDAYQRTRIPDTYDGSDDVADVPVPMSDDMASMMSSTQPQQRNRMRMAGGGGKGLEKGRRRKTGSEKKGKFPTNKFVTKDGALKPPAPFV
jgi:hypothetical protein